MDNNKKEGASDYLMIRNILNVIFILLVVAFMVLYFTVKSQPLSNVWCVGTGVVAIFVKMIESVLRVMTNVQNRGRKAKNIEE